MLQVKNLINFYISDLVQEVHSAQKRRDESMMGRLQMANDEKDEMINRLREIEQKLEDQ